jgi:hypothetical protein
VCLWLILDFQFWHAFGFGLVMWLILMLAVLPLLFKTIEDSAKLVSPRTGIGMVWIARTIAQRHES